MNCWNSEPSLIDALCDPIVQAIMAADGVDPQRLKARLSVELSRREDDGGAEDLGCQGLVTKSSGSQLG